MTSDRGKPRILVLRGGAIGDFIMTLPALQALRDRWPKSYVEIIGYPHIANLALACGLADHVSSLDKAEVARFFSVGPDLSPRQIAHLKSFDMIVCYLYDPDGILRANMTIAGAKHIIYGSPRVRGEHAVDHLMRPLVELAIFGRGNEVPALRLTESCRLRGKAVTNRIGNNVLAVHPGSGNPKKNWPPEKFLALAARARDEARLSPAFIVGEADHSVAEALRRMGSTVPVISGCSLVELAGALSSCRAYVGNDSGVTHIAAAIGLPVVAIYGPTDPAVWGPRSGKARIVRAINTGNGGIAGIPIDAVFDRLSETLKSA